MNALTAVDIVRLAIEHRASSFYVSDGGGVWLSSGTNGTWELEGTGKLTVQDILRFTTELDHETGAVDNRTEFFAGEAEIDGQKIRFAFRRRNSVGATLTGHLQLTASEFSF